MNFGEILAQALIYRGTTPSNDDASVLGGLRQAINDYQREALTTFEAPWATREHRFITETAFTGGAVRFTNGNSLLTEVTDGANGWSLSLEGRRAVVATGAEIYSVVDFLAGANAGLRIDPPYYRATGTGTYAIYQVEYDLPGDFHQMRSVKLESQGQFIDYIDPWQFDQYVARPTDLSPGLPRIYTIAERTRQPLLTNSGNVIFTAFSDRAVFSGITLATDDARYRGASLRLSGTTTVMPIRAVIGVTSALLYEMWRGSTLTSQSFEVVPSGQYRITLWPFPSTTEMVTLRYYHHPVTMVNTDDQPIIPEAHHDYLWKGGAYFLGVFEANEQMQPMISMLEGQFLDAKRRMIRALRTERDQVPQRGSYQGGGGGPRDPMFPNTYPNRSYRRRW